MNQVRRACLELQETQETLEVQASQEAKEKRGTEDLMAVQASEVGAGVYFADCFDG